MCVQLVGKDDDLVHFGQRTDRLLDKVRKTLFVPCGLQMGIDQLPVPHIYGGDQSGRPVACVPELFAFVPALAWGGGGPVPFNGLDTCLFVNTQYVQVRVAPFGGGQDKMAGQGNTLNESVPIVDLGEKPIFAFMGP